MTLLLLLALALCALSQVVAFSAVSSRCLASQRTAPTMLFDFFGPKKTASASHILIKGGGGVNTLLGLKEKISASPNVQQAFAEAAAQYSSCPSAKNGGALGTFKKGQMVPAFDKVVFNDEVGVIHGPISTPFGSHLILIDSRS